MTQITSTGSNKHLNTNRSQLQLKSTKLKWDCPCPRNEGLWV